MSKKKRREIPHFGKPIIETHCHLDYLKSNPLGEILEQAQAVGIERIVTIAVAPDNLETISQLAASHEIIWGTQGVHPHDAVHFDENAEVLIRENLHQARIVAVGEIGLDYHYEYSDRATQRRVFEKQLQIAVDHQLPVVIHTREADADTRAILSNFIPQMKYKGVVHSFTSGLELAEYCIAEGFCLGFNGICTFNRAENVRDAIRITPLDRILLETDAPFLTPVPYRGRENAPCYLPFVAEKIAEVKSETIDTVLQQTYANSIRVFFAGNDADA